MRKKFTMLLAALFLLAGIAKAQYYVIESIGDNITDLDALTDGSYVAFYNVGKQKFIYEGALDHKLYMGMPADNDGHEYIWQVRKDGEQYAFTAVSGRFFPTPLDGNDVYTVASDHDAKDKFTITAHQENGDKWKVQSLNNANIYWDAQDSRFVGWQGSGANSQYEIRPITVTEISSEAHPLSQFITVNEEEIKWLYIKNIRCGKYATYTGESAKMALGADATTKSLFYLTGKVDVSTSMATVKIHNYATEKLCNENKSWTSQGRNWYIQSSQGQNIHPGWAISKTTDLTKNEAWNNESGSGYNIAYWNGNDQGSTWEFVTADYDALMSNLQSLIEAELKPAIEEGKQAVANGGYEVDEVKLTESMLYCNAPYTAKDNEDALGVKALVDGKDDTYLHTDYSGMDSKDGEDHYVRVDLGEGKSATYFTFNYKSRHNNANNNPVVMVVEGSNEADGGYSEIAKLDNLPQGLLASFESNVLGNGNAYRYFRFKVTATTNNAKQSGHVFFTMSSFGFKVVSVNEGLEIKTKVYSNLRNAIAVAESLAGKNKLAEDDINEAAAAIKYIVSGLEVVNYPFKLTTDINNPVYYHIKSGRSQDWSGNYYWTFIDGKITTITADDNYAKDIETYWFFMENPETGHLQFVPFIEHTSPMGYVTVENSSDRITNKIATSGFVGADYKLVTTTNDEYENYPYALKPSCGDNVSTYVSNNGGNSGRYLGFWSGLADGGTRFAVEEVTITPSSKLRDLRNAIIAVQANAPTAGSEIGTYTQASVDAYTAKITEAQNVYNDATKEESEYKAQINVLNSASSVLAINVPETGKFYRLKNAESGNYMSGNTNGIILLADGAESVSTIFYLGENNTLLSYNSGLYLDCYNKANAAVGTSYNGEFGVAFGGVTPNVVTYKNNGAFTYGAGSNGASIDRGTSAPDKIGYNWAIEEVTTLPVTISAVGYATFYAPVEVTLPEDGVTAHTVVVKSDYAILSEEIKVVPAQNGVILTGEEGTYELDITSTQTADIESALEGTVADAYVAKDAYVLAAKNNNVGLYRATLNQKDNTAFLNQGFKAYLPAPAGSAAPMFSFTRGEDTTGIENSEITIQNSTVIYDLLGRRVEKMEKGIYIVNGKKVIR